MQRDQLVVAHEADFEHGGQDLRLDLNSPVDRGQRQLATSPIASMVVAAGHAAYGARAASRLDDHRAWLGSEPGA